MKKIVPVLLLFTAGCSPIAIDFTAGWGANQQIKKTLDMNQKQTKAQTEAQSDIIGDIVDAITTVYAAPTPTPTPIKVKSLTIDFAGASEQAQPPPAPVLVEVKRKKLAPKTSCVMKFDEKNRVPYCESIEVK